MKVAGWKVRLFDSGFKYAFMSKFRFKIESRSFLSLILKLYAEILKCNTVKSCFVIATLLKSFMSH